jgi:hypothetical protein
MGVEGAVVVIVLRSVRIVGVVLELQISNNVSMSGQLKPLAGEGKSLIAIARDDAAACPSARQAAKASWSWRQCWFHQFLQKRLRIGVVRFGSVIATCPSSEKATSSSSRTYRPTP